MTFTDHDPDDDAPDDAITNMTLTLDEWATAAAMLIGNGAPIFGSFIDAELLAAVAEGWERPNDKIVITVPTEMAISIMDALISHWRDRLAAVDYASTIIRNHARNT
ncbi:MAG TPA: hypothetical protein VNJ04_19615 [Gemmatimonadaceae bacterium]|nr:hypothetical protein [Gemmatimonadaceae bacterium]